MKKMKLDLDQLSVETFATTSGEDDEGTVVGNQVRPPRTLRTCWDTCGTCICQLTGRRTCDTCYRTCDQTCGPTCELTCQFTCPRTCMETCELSCRTCDTCFVTCRFTCDTCFRCTLGRTCDFCR